MVKPYQSDILKFEFIATVKIFKKIIVYFVDNKTFGY